MKKYTRTCLFDCQLATKILILKNKFFFQKISDWTKMIFLLVTCVLKIPQSLWSLLIELLMINFNKTGFHCIQDCYLIMDYVISWVLTIWMCAWCKTVMFMYHSNTVWHTGVTFHNYKVFKNHKALNTARLDWGSHNTMHYFELNITIGLCFEHVTWKCYQKQQATVS